MLPKSVIIGVNSLIGREILSEHRRIYPDCVGTTRNSADNNFFYLDLFSPDISSFRLSHSGHRDALIFAGISKIATCHDDFATAKKVNLDGTLTLIKQLVGEGIKPIFFSSDQVFDGTQGNYNEDSPLKPLNEYGRFKAEVETYMKERCNGRYLVIRLGKIFTLEKNSVTILDEMASTLVSGGVVRAAYDQIFNLATISDLVAIVTALQEKDLCGVYNVCSPEVWSRYDLALRMAESLEINTHKVERISLDKLGESFKRPKNTSMLTSKLHQDINFTFTPIEHCVQTTADNWKKTFSI